MSDETGRDPFEFDARGLCCLQAQYVDFIYLSLPTWKSHSTNHKGEDRSYFAQFRCNREAICETAKSPSWISRFRNQFADTLYFVKTVKLQRFTEKGVVIPFTIPLLIVVRGHDRMVQTFYPTSRTTPRGEVVYSA